MVKKRGVKKKKSKVFYVVNYFLYGAPWQSTDRLDCNHQFDQFKNASRQIHWDGSGTVINAINFYVMEDTKTEIATELSIRLQFFSHDT